MESRVSRSSSTIMVSLRISRPPSDPVRGRNSQESYRVGPPPATARDRSRGLYGWSWPFRGRWTKGGAKPRTLPARLAAHWGYMRSVYLYKRWALSQMRLGEGDRFSISMYGSTGLSPGIEAVGQGRRAIRPRRSGRRTPRGEHFVAADRLYAKYGYVSARLYPYGPTRPPPARRTWRRAGPRGYRASPLTRGRPPTSSSSGTLQIY
jgi:hypothetical protein